MQFPPNIPDRSPWKPLRLGEYLGKAAPLHRSTPSTLMLHGSIHTTNGVHLGQLTTRGRSTTAAVRRTDRASLQLYSRTHSALARLCLSPHVFGSTTEVARCLVGIVLCRLETDGIEAPSCLDLPPLNRRWPSCHLGSLESLLHAAAMDLPPVCLRSFFCISVLALALVVAKRGNPLIETNEQTSQTREVGLSKPIHPLDLPPR